MSLLNLPSLQRRVNGPGWEGDRYCAHVQFPRSRCFSPRVIGRSCLATQCVRSERSPISAASPVIISLCLSLSVDSSCARRADTTVSVPMISCRGFSCWRHRGFDLLRTSSDRAGAIPSFRSHRLGSSEEGGATGEGVSVLNAVDAAAHVWDVCVGGSEDLLLPPLPPSGASGSAPNSSICWFSICWLSICWFLFISIRDNCTSQ